MDDEISKLPSNFSYGSEPVQTGDRENQVNGEQADNMFSSGDFPDDGPTGVYKRGQRRGRGRKLILGLIALLLVFGLGYAGGRLAVQGAIDELRLSLQDNIAEYMEQAGGAVLYRDVETHYSSPAAINEMSVVDVAKLAADSVVEILTETEVSMPFNWFFGRESRSIVPGSGSGIILSENGYILTSYHVIENANNITVSLRSGHAFPAEVIGSDTTSDVAILKIDPQFSGGEDTGGQNADLTPAVFGDSDQLEVGSPVVAIGNPLGQLGGTVTAGYISALDRNLQVGNNTYTLLQTDAAINGGNSGGGLFNAQGELVGLVMAKSSGISAGGMVVEGLGFAIPINEIKGVIDDLLNYGQVNRVALGISMLDILDDRTAASYYVDQPGVYIISVDPNSNARYAGLQSGDRIKSIDGVLIESGAQVQEIVGGKQFNDSIEMVVVRDGEEIEMRITFYATIPDEGAVIPTSL